MIALSLGGVVLAALAALAALVFIPLGLIPLAFDVSAPEVLLTTYSDLYARSVSTLLN